ncbi:nuclear transport factor 2 family protein [Saccharothrix algeriensis]|uniref:Nuclear transport factor 2 family protein n=1 Tax=Saccharothrix algeriensis TaxID=173560 RepID=A0A8T8I323_9PSEU|nr:nuclear transport factor 2 family protein [Saccharothrix algeriensis]QTR04394.1 nuclear transport factor 2 family protein [Saccharothrix algeriensis]
MSGVPGSGAGFVPTDEDVAGVLDWFARWDALAVAKDVEAMAGMALFPVNAVTDGAAELWDRERFLKDMAAQLGDGDVRMESVRTPVFVNAGLVFVITDATITVGDFSQVVRYGDLLVKVAGEWRFQTMVQGGW